MSEEKKMVKEIKEIQEKKYKYTLPEIVKNGLLTFNEVDFGGTKYTKEEASLFGKIFSFDEYMQALRDGFKEECFSEYFNEKENFEKQVKELMLKIEDKYLNIDDKHRVLIHIQYSNAEIFLFKDKNSYFYKFPINVPVETGLGIGNEEGYLYKYFMNQYKHLKNGFTSRVIVLNKEYTNFLFEKKYKYYLVGNNPKNTTTGSGAGQLTQWRSKMDKSEKENYSIAKKVDSVKYFNREVFKKIFEGSKNV